jgi:hypothetical protein
VFDASLKRFDQGQKGIILGVVGIAGECFLGRFERFDYRR